MIRILLVGFMLGVSGGFCPGSTSAVAQEAALDLDGTWEFDYEIVQVTQNGSAVRAAFLEGAECFDGQMRPWFLDGVLSGTSLTGRMMVCSQSPRLVEECGISSMYETSFEATVEEGRITGTRVAQGLATEEEGGRYTSCVPDSRYDGTYPFEGVRSCDDLAGEMENLFAVLQGQTEALNDLSDQISGTPDVGNWPEEGYDGPAADLAGEWREGQRRMIEEGLPRLHEAEARLARCRGGAGECPGASEAADLWAELGSMVEESNAIADEFAALSLVGWFEEGYAGLYADRAARWREIEQEMLQLIERINATQDLAEKAALQAQADALGAEANEIEDLLNPLNVTDWTQDDYVGPNEERADRWHALNSEMEILIVQLQDAEERLRECREAVG